MLHAAARPPRQSFADTPSTICGARGVGNDVIVFFVLLVVNAHDHCLQVTLA